MDREFHKKETFYNTDKVNHIIGLQGRSYIFDTIDVFVERVNKKNGFAIVKYTDYENGKEVEKQYVPYIETEKDLKEFINTCMTKKLNIHYIDYANVYFYVHADKEEKGYMDMNYVEYKDGNPKRSIMRVSRNNEFALNTMLGEYQKQNTQSNTVFTGYYRDPADMPKRLPRKVIREQKEANSMPMPEPKIKLRIVEDTEYLYDSIKNYIIDRFGPKEENTELHYRTR